MPHYRWDGVGLFRDAHTGRDIEPGETVTLPERIGEPQKEMVRVGDDEPTEEDVSGAEDEDEAAEPGFDVTEVTEAHWNAASTAIRDGEHDDHLTAIEHADDRESVLNAVTDRRDELG